MDKLDQATIDFIDVMRACPDCHTGDLRMGPMGGSSVNIKCSNDNCRHEFSVAYTQGRVLMGERLNRDDGSLYSNEVFLPKRKMPEAEDVRTEDPPPQRYKIDTLYVVIAVREGHGEGIMAMGPEGIASIPMVFSNPKMLELVVPMAAQLAEEQGVKAVLRTFTMVSEQEL